MNLKQLKALGAWAQLSQPEKVFIAKQFANPKHVNRIKTILERAGNKALAADVLKQRERQKP